MNSNQKIVLLVEDDPVVIFAIREKLLEKACTIHVAKDFFGIYSAISSVSRITHVLLDGFLQNNETDIWEETPDIIPFIREELPNAVLVAMSGNELMRKLQVEKGCNIAVDKRNIYTYIKNEM